MQGYHSGVVDRRRGEPPCADRLGQVDGRLLRRYAQIGVEEPYTLLILSEGRPLPIRPGVQLHEHTVRGLVERSELKPALCEADRSLVRALALMPHAQPLQSISYLSAERLALKVLPLIKHWAVRQGEARHKVAGIQRHRFAQPRGAAHAKDAVVVVVAACLGELCGERGDVRPDRELRVERDVPPVGEEQPGAEGGPKRRELAPKPVARTGVV
jgi:hypothetical protein